MSRLTKDQLGIFTGDLFVPLMRHIEALESALALNQAAIVREVGQLAVRHKGGISHGKDCECLCCELLAIPTDQPALERHDAELKAHFAAVMEKLADDLLIAIESEDSPVENAEYEHRFIVSRIPTDYADALAERVREAVRDERKRLIATISWDSSAITNQSWREGYDAAMNDAIYMLNRAAASPVSEQAGAPEEGNR